MVRWLVHSHPITEHPPLLRRLEPLHQWLCTTSDDHERNEFANVCSVCVMGARKHIKIESKPFQTGWEERFLAKSQKSSAFTRNNGGLGRVQLMLPKCAFDNFAAPTLVLSQLFSDAFVK